MKTKLTEQEFLALPQELQVRYILQRVQERNEERDDNNRQEDGNSKTIH